MKRKLLLGSGVTGASLLLAASPALAQDADDPSVYLQAVMDNLWVFIAGILVFFMQAGFALVEAGLTRSKNVANIMAKNIADMCIGVLAFYAVGYAFAYGDGGGWFIGGNSYFLSGSSLFEITDGLSGATDFFFQVVFAATAVTIASGAMAGRTKFSAYLMFAALMTAFIYPVVVHWTWGGGLIAEYINWDSMTVKASAIEEFVNLVKEATNPIDDHRSSSSYRLHTIGVLAQRALMRSFGTED